MDFWQEIAKALIGSFTGSFMGAGVALLIGFFTRKSQNRAQEHAALSGLLLDLNLKRAFAIVTPRVVVASAAQQDISQSTTSVLQSRDLIREARLKLQPNSVAFEHLASMARACNLYLEQIQRDPGNYQFALEELRTSLDAAAKQLSEPKDVSYLPPGGGAFTPSE